ncbi:MAG: agmatine/peptidylarginine deiminase [Fimbriimonadaceae bacterium]
MTHGIRLPAEWEPQAATWLCWPTEDPKRGVDARAATLRLIEVLGPGNTVRLAVANAQVAADAEKALGNRFPQVQITATGHREVWMRDCGPVFVVGTHGASMVRYGFDFWGYGAPFHQDATAELVAQTHDALLLGLQLTDVDLVSEGGNRESNGEGTLMLVEAVERSRNPGWSRSDIEACHAGALGVTSFIWIPEGVAEDDHPARTSGYLTPMTTGGHVDNIARFVAPDTVLLAEVDDGNDPLTCINRERLSRAEAAIRAARDSQGRPFQLARLPLPPPIFDEVSEGDAVHGMLRRVLGTERVPETARIVHAASTMNFIIANGVVVAPKYGRPERPRVYRDVDERVAETLGRLFPERRVEMIEPEAWNLGGGGPHCVTAHQPRFDAQIPGQVP